MSIRAFQATTPFIGRRQEIGDLRRALASSRSVTLIGIGGAGKTRLAERLLHEVEDGLDGSTWAVELGQVHDPDLVQLAVASAMGLRPQPGQRQVEAICTFLGEGPALLVIDNCEHLLAACASLVSDLVSSCPGLQVVATSRQPLGISGELVYTVGPLSVPELPPGRAPAVRVQDLAGCESVDLFVERARVALPGFELTDDNAASVARLCVALEGIPLALELAAARIRVLSPAEMLDRIEQRYHLLARGYVDMPDRQRSMEASVEWSHDLCTPQEQLLWARLSVFSGGFDLDAAEIVCSDDDLPADAVLDVLSSLVDKSLVSRDLQVSRSHFTMLETIRLYGAARLALTGDADLWRRRHRDHVARLARRFHERWVGRDQPHLMATMRRNHANLRSVLERSAAGPEDAEVTLRAAVDLEEYWAVTGLLTEARHWLDAALAEGAGSTVERAGALSICGYLADFQSQADEAARRLADARSELATLGPEPVPGDQDGAEGADGAGRALAWARWHFAESVHAMYAGDLAAAEEHARRSIGLFEAVGEVHGLPAAHVVLGVCLSAGGRRAEGAAAHTRALAMTEPRGELHIRGLALWALSVDTRREGELDRASELACLSLDLRSQIGDDAGVALALESLAAITAEQGDAVRSATLLGAAVRLWERLGLHPLAGQYVAAPREGSERTAREQLHARAFDAAHRRGRTMPVAQAVDYALGRLRNVEPTGLEDTPLTTRERQVAALIGEGMSNQQIATRLVISVRTAQGHVENILRKLGFSSRTQVAAWVVGRGVGGLDRLDAG